MLDSLQIEGFRCFERFEMKDLARINLLVGTNNCGKTTLLESFELLLTGAAPQVLEQVLLRRDEHVTKTQNSPDLAVRHLFYGHQLEPGQTFTISGRRGGEDLTLHASIEEDPGLGNDLTEQSQPVPLASGDSTELELREGPLVLRVAMSGGRNNADTRRYRVRLTVEGDLPVRVLRRMPRSKTAHWRP